MKPAYNFKLTHNFQIQLLFFEAMDYGWDFPILCIHKTVVRTKSTKLSFLKSSWFFFQACSFLELLLSPKRWYHLILGWKQVGLQYNNFRTFQSFCSNEVRSVSWFRKEPIRARDHDFRIICFPWETNKNPLNWSEKDRGTRRRDAWKPSPAGEAGTWQNNEMWAGPCQFHERWQKTITMSKGIRFVFSWGL